MVAKLTSECWDKCITGTPGNKFSSSESNCLSNCAHRYLEMSMLIMKRFQSMQWRWKVYPEISHLHDRQYWNLIIWKLCFFGLNYICWDSCVQIFSLHFTFLKLCPNIWLSWNLQRKKPTYFMNYIYGLRGWNHKSVAISNSQSNK